MLKKNGAHYIQLSTKSMVERWKQVYYKITNALNIKISNNAFQCFYDIIKPR